MQYLADDETVDYIENVMAAAPVVIAIIPKSIPEGAGLHVLKGSRELGSKLALLAAIGGTVRLEGAHTICCVDFDEAFTWRDVFGDGRCNDS
jgi:hypothetical protein